MLLLSQAFIIYLSSDSISVSTDWKMGLEDRGRWERKDSKLCDYGVTSEHTVHCLAQTVYSGIDSVQWYRQLQCMLYSCYCYSPVLKDGYCYYTLTSVSICLPTYQSICLSIHPSVCPPFPNLVWQLAVIAHTDCLYHSELYAMACRYWVVLRVNSSIWMPPLPQQSSYTNFLLDASLIWIPMSAAFPHPHPLHATCCMDVQRILSKINMNSKEAIKVVQMYRELISNISSWEVFCC